MMKNFLAVIMSISTFLTPFAFIAPVLAAAPSFDTTGTYVAAVNYQGTDYMHDMTLNQGSGGNLTGNGGSPVGANVYQWTITSGNVNGNTIDFLADYTMTADAVTPQTTMHVLGTIAVNGTMSGTWSDNYQGGNRSGTWSSTSGTASPLGNLSAEDFGVVNYDSGLGIIKGYTAGFGLTGATFAGASSVVVKLYAAGNTLLQTNTAILPKFNADIVGTQFSSPFDVSGTFNYATDGYWVNAREAEFGQSVPATKVVATVTLQNGKVVTAQNTNPTGDPTTIYPPVAPATVTVTIEKFVGGAMATALSANNADFPMTSTWDADNIGAGTGAYALSETNETPYKAVTSVMSKGADYSTGEVLTGPVVSASCASEKPFALVGYTTGETRALAMAATPSMTMPTFTNLQSSKYVIVWNRDCALPLGQIGGEVVGDDGVLQVTSIDMTDTTATANGSFADGWKYTFHITAPTSEPDLAMKFSNWLQTGGSGVITVANNMRISSAQANNAGATILLTAQNVYSTPELHMTTDLNPTLAGRQVMVLVEVAVPNGTPNGSYTTSYGVQSNP